MLSLQYNISMVICNIADQDKKASAAQLNSNKKVTGISCIFIQLHKNCCTS